MKRPLALIAAQVGMFVFVIVLAWNIHPYIVRYNGNLVWVLSFLTILGLLMLPGWLFKRHQRLTNKPIKLNIVKVWKSLPFSEGTKLVVFNTHIGPMAGLKGFRTMVVDDPESLPSQPRSPIWNILRWIVVLPVAAILYVLVAIFLVPLFDTHPHVPGHVEYFLVFVVSALVAVFAGAFTAPSHRAWVAGVLTLLLAGVLTFFALTFDGGGTEATALRQSILLQLAGALLVVYLFWWKDRRAARTRP
ncbi:hypothetical protein [Deinococcus sp. UYEF24]